MPNQTVERMKAMDDEELEAVSGGVDIVFQNGGVERDSWFVSLVTRQMVQSSIRNYLNAPGRTVPDVIQVGDRSFRVRQTGETYYVEAL